LIDLSAGEQLQEKGDWVGARIHPVQRGDRKAAEHRGIPCWHPPICSQRVVLGEPHVQVRVQPIGFANEDYRADKLLPEHNRDTAYQQGKNEGLRCEFVIALAFFGGGRISPSREHARAPYPAKPIER
jgi:hypothetical protein